MTTAGESIPTEGYTYFTIYRNHAVYCNLDAEKYQYAAGKGEAITVFAESFGSLRAQLDEIVGAVR